MPTFICRNSVWKQWNTGLYMLPVTFGHRNSKSGSKPIDILNQWGQMVCMKQNINYVILWTDSLLAPFIPLFVFFSPLATLFMARFFAIGTPASGVLVLSDLFNVQNICKWTRHELVQWYGNKINDRIFHDGLRAFGDVFNGDKTFLWPFEYNNSSQSKELKLTIIFYARSCVDLFSFFLSLLF